LGGGITNMVMPLIFAGIIALGYSKSEAWRLAMIVPAFALLVMAFLYYKFTKDTPQGNYADLKKESKKEEKTSLTPVLTDWRVWALAFAYAVCFGMEITFDNVAALYFVDNFKLSQAMGGFLAGIFGFMNIFARAVGGIVADKVGRKYGMNGKGWLLAGVLALEGVGLIIFSMSGNLGMAIVSMLSFAMFLKMANGATYAIVPFVNLKNVGMVSGIVGAGGNFGGMLFGFLFKSESITYSDAFLYIGIIVTIVSLLVFLTKFEKASALKKEAEAAELATVQA
jgi:NNP family nitrate/nitrite transporter-like MFS transporter